MGVCSPFLEYWLPLLNVSEVNYILFSIGSTCTTINFSSYFLLLKQEQHFIPCNRRAELISNSSLQKPSTYKTYWIRLKLLIWTSVTILSTCAKFHRVSVTRMWEKNNGRYSWSASCAYNVWNAILTCPYDVFALLCMFNYTFLDTVSNIFMEQK